MTPDHDVYEDTAEELFEDAPCGYLTTDMGGLIVKVNRTFESWTGWQRDELVGRRRFQDLLTSGGQIYHETHYRPLLQMQGSVREIAVEIRRTDDTTVPVLVNSILRHDADGVARAIRTTVFDATDRRRYEQELLDAHRRERGIARELQHSLLAGAMPDLPGYSLAAEYHPGVRGLEVGGDWYDAFWIEPGEVAAIVIGDVVGRGIGAAATMGQLRSATRALATRSDSPGEVLVALDDYARLHGVGQMATTIFGRLRLATGELTLASAGHLPPVLIPAQGPARLIWEGRSVPLDVAGRNGERRAETTLSLDPGAGIVFFTDGLVEIRSRAIDHGLDRVVAAAEARRGGPFASLARTLVADVPPDAPDDDVCVLTLCRKDGPEPGS